MAARRTVILTDGTRLVSASSRRYIIFGIDNFGGVWIYRRTDDRNRAVTLHGHSLGRAHRSVTCDMHTGAVLRDSAAADVKSRF